MYDTQPLSVDLYAVCYYITSHLSLRWLQAQFGLDNNFVEGPPFFPLADGKMLKTLADSSISSSSVRTSNYSQSTIIL